MSKYRERGRYHFNEFDNDTPYRHHMLDVIEHVKKHAAKSESILDVGCGEGLLVHRLGLEGFNAHGIDADPEAVKLADPERVSLEEFDGNHMGYDVVMFMDSLEHMKAWREILLATASNAKMLFIAVPDRHDPHAVEQDLGPKIKSFMFSNCDFALKHLQIRHARSFQIYTKFTGFVK